MKNHLILLCLLLVLISCGKKSSITDFIDNPDDSRNPYTISSTHVGTIARGTNIHQLYSIFPAKQIKLTKNKGGFFNQEFDDYNVYDANYYSQRLRKLPEIPVHSLIASSSGTRHSKHRKESA